jgi:hypothetical protein
LKRVIVAGDATDGRVATVKWLGVCGHAANIIPFPTRWHA